MDSETMERIKSIICFVRLKAIHNVILESIKIEKREQNPRNFMRLLANVFIDTLKPGSGLRLLQKDDKDETKPVELYNSRMPGSVESPSYNAYFFMSLMNKSGCFSVTNMPFLQNYQGDMYNGYFTVNSDGTTTKLVDTIKLIHDDFYKLCDFNIFPTQIDGDEDGVFGYNLISSRKKHELFAPSHKAGYTPDSSTWESRTVDSKKLMSSNGAEKGVERVFAFLDDVEDAVRKHAIEFAIKTGMNITPLDLDDDSTHRVYNMVTKKFETTPVPTKIKLKNLERKVRGMTQAELKSWTDLLDKYGGAGGGGALKKINSGNKKSRRRKIQTRRLKTHTRRRKTSRK